MKVLHYLIGIGTAALLCSGLAAGTPEETAKEIIGKHTVRGYYGRYRDKALCEELLAYYEANRAKFSEAEQSAVLRKLLFHTASYSNTDRSFHDRALAHFAAAPASVKSGLYLSLIADGAGQYANGSALDFAEEIYAKHIGEIPASNRLSAWIYSNFARQVAKHRTDRPKIEFYLNELLNLKYDGPADNAGEKARFDADFRKQIQLFFGNLIVADSEMGSAIVEKYRASLTDADFGPLCVSFCKAGIKELNRALLDNYLAKAKAIKDAAVRFATLEGIAIAAGPNSPVGKALFAEQMKSASTPMEKLTMLSDLSKSLQPSWFTYNFNDPEAYPAYLKTIFAMIELVKENPKFIGDHKYIFPIRHALSTAYNFGDYVSFDKILEANYASMKTIAEGEAKRLRGNADYLRTKKNQPEEAAKEDAKADALLKNWRAPIWDITTKNLIRKGDLKGASALLAEVAETNVNAKEKQNAAVVRYFLNGGTFDGFDAAFANLKLNSEGKMDAIREAGRFFFVAGDYATARKLHAEVAAKMFKAPTVNKHYTVKYQLNPPKTAEAWAKSPAYQNWAEMETRFAPYGGYEMSKKENLAFLKDAPEVKLDDVYKAGLQIVYDDDAVHIYLRINDPDAKEVIQRKRKGPSLEWMFRPGEAHAYHSIYFSDGLPDASDRWYVNWCAPTKHYRLTYDGIQKDAVVTPEGYAAHITIPWLFVWDRLPAQNNVWRLGLQIWGEKGMSRSLSGLVHEQARALKLDFKFTAAERVMIERSIALQAFNTYNTIRQDAGGIIQNWNDAYLGDPEFYRTVLKDFIAELDAAGEKLTASAPDAEIHTIYEKYVPLWAEIKYVLEEKRADYLKRALFRKP